jgi:hypothetical protein
MTPSNLAHVNPGDRITAAFMNALVDEINSLQEQVDALGTVDTGSGPVITALQPAGEVAVGGELDVIGRNFGVPATQNVVTLDGTPVTGFLPGCTATLLRLAVPGIAGLPKDAELAVQTTAGTARRSIHVVAAVVLPEGRPTLSNTSGSLGTISAGGQYTFSFRIDATSVSIPERYRVDVAYDNALPASVPASAWSAATALIGVAGGEVTVAPGTPVTVGVQVVIPAGADSADMRVTVTSVHNDPGSSAVPLSIPIVVGEAQESDPRIHTPAIGAIGGAAPFHVAADGALEVRYAASSAGTVAQVPVDLGFDVGGTYHYDVSLESSAAGVWTLGAVKPNDLHFDAGATPQVHFPLTLLATGPSNEARFLRFVVTRTDTDSVGQISNFLRLQIRGFHP